MTASPMRQLTAAAHSRSPADLVVTADPSLSISPENRCQSLESGHILLLKDSPFVLPAEDRQFLLTQKWSTLRLHKNVSYRLSEDKLRGFTGDSATADRLRQILRIYSMRVVAFLRDFLAPYADRWLLDYASFWPFEEKGRDLPLHKRNDLLHVDAFPSRPTRGGRILRGFTNVNPTRPRVWHSTIGFEALAQQYANAAGLQRMARGSIISRTLQTVNRHFGFSRANSVPYDRFMLRFHDYLKENAEFQANCPKIRVEFPPLSTWMAFTCGVAHAVMSGQYAIAQTLIVPAEALVAPQYAPCRILEKIAGCPVVS